GELSWSPPKLAEAPVPGYDFSGYVISAPPHSTFKPGAQVYGRTAFNRAGNARSYSLATFPELGLKPKNLSWELAATVPISALTAYQALFDHLEFVPPKEWSAQHTSPCNGKRRLLVTGGAGAVGMWVVQLAKLSGVGHIAATCGPSNVDFVRSLGVHEVLDYTKPEGDLLHWPKNRSKFDVVVDCVGGEALAAAWTVVRQGGTLLSVAMPPKLKKPASNGDVEPDIKTAFFVQVADSYQLEQVTMLLEQGLLRTVVENVFPLEEFQAAMDKANAGHSRGKVVLKVNQEDPRPLIKLLLEHRKLNDYDALEKLMEEGGDDLDDEDAEGEDYDGEDLGDEEDSGGGENYEGDADDEAEDGDDGKQVK
ncbi:NAD(P)-binding protein, partial [Thozetella sp. PMI_491]